MPSEPYAYAKNPVPGPSRARQWIGAIMLIASLVLIGTVLWQLRRHQELVPAEDGLAGGPALKRP